MEIASSRQKKGGRIAGKVIHGRKQGRKLGFPTANVDANELIDNGVYGVIVYLNGEQYQGIMNIGVKPTYGSDLEKTFEVHILDFHGDIYGKSIECQIVFKIRQERKFPSLEALIQQIKGDVQHANQKFELLGYSSKNTKSKFTSTERVS